MSEIAHCHPTLSFRGDVLSGHTEYQAIEDYYYYSLVLYDIAPGGAVSWNWELTGNFPSGLSPETPSAPTSAIHGIINTILDNNILEQLISTWDAKTPRNYNVANSNQGTFNLTPRFTGTILSKTFNFGIKCSGATAESGPYSVELPLTMTVFKNWTSDSLRAQPVLEEKKSIRGK